MDITLLEAVRFDGTTIAVDGKSEAKDFAALRAAFEAPQVAAAPTTPVKSESAPAEASRAAAAKPAATEPTAEATVAAWTAFFGTMLETGPRREGELESARMARELIRISQPPLANVDPALAKEISSLIDLQKERMEQCCCHDAALDSFREPVM